MSPIKRVADCTSNSNQIETQVGPMSRRSCQGRFFGCLFGKSDSHFGIAVETSGRRQAYQAGFAHARHGDSAAHVLESAVGLVPFQGFANQSGNPGAAVCRISRDNGAYGFYFLGCEISAAISINAHFIRRNPEAPVRKTTRPAVALSYSRAENLQCPGEARLRFPRRLADTFRATARDSN